MVWMADHSCGVGFGELGVVLSSIGDLRGYTSAEIDVEASARSGSAPPPGPSRDGLIEIRWHGRGGQGVVTAGELLAEAALFEGRYFQAFPEFGAERTGAPILAYTRLSPRPIDLHCPIAEPDIVVVLDATLLSAVDVSQGLKNGGIVLINAPNPLPPAVRALAGSDRGTYALDATGIALDNLGRNIPNTAMIGALLNIAPVVGKSSCLDAMEKRLSARFPRKIVDANVRSFWQAHTVVREYKG